MQEVEYIIFVTNEIKFNKKVILYYIYGLILTYTEKKNSAINLS